MWSVFWFPCCKEILHILVIWIVVDRLWFYAFLIIHLWILRSWQYFIWVCLWYLCCIVLLELPYSFPPSLFAILAGILLLVLGTARSNVLFWRMMSYLRPAPLFCPVLCMNVCMNVCVCVCMYVWTHICMYICMYVCTYECMFVCMYVCMYVRVYVCRYVCIYVRICIFVFIRFVNTYVYMNVWFMYIWMYLGVYVRL